MRIDLTKGITETSQYKAWKFPGGEIHVQLKDIIEPHYETPKFFDISTRLNTSDDIMFLLIFTDMLKKDYRDAKINLFLPYMPYQQADKNFGRNECFSLKTMCNLINSMNYNKVTVYAPHSEVGPGLLNNCEVIDNTSFVYSVLARLNIKDEDLIICSPDAGAYKLIFKLVEKIGFKGDIITCSKSRNHTTGALTIQVPTCDPNKSVLILDDICLAGNTFFNIRKELKNENVYLAVSHGIFNDNVNRLETEFTKVFTTNSRRNEYITNNLEIINIF